MKKFIALILVVLTLSSLVIGFAAPKKEYAKLEILDEDINYGYGIVKVDKHIYSMSSDYDDMEERSSWLIRKDGKVEYRFPFKLGSLRGIVQIEGEIYVAFPQAIYKYKDKKITLITDKITGYIHTMVANGTDLYTLCDDDSPSRKWRYMEGSYFKVTTKGEVTKIPGAEQAIDYIRQGFSFDTEGENMVRISFRSSSITVRGKGKSEYTQRIGDYLEWDEFSVDNVIYYNNCLIANVKGSLVYYDSTNKRHLLLGDMLGSSMDRESYISQAPGSVPIETGEGKDVKIGYVLDWTLGDDGCIYGITQDNYDRKVAFKLTIPDSIQKVTTYVKKTW